MKDPQSTATRPQKKAQESADVILERWDRHLKTISVRWAREWWARHADPIGLLDLAGLVPLIVFVFLIAWGAGISIWRWAVWFAPVALVALYLGRRGQRDALREFRKADHELGLVEESLRRKLDVPNGEIRQGEETGGGPGAAGLLRLERDVRRLRSALREHAIGCGSAARPSRERWIRIPGRRSALELWSAIAREADPDRRRLLHRPLEIEPRRASSLLRDLRKGRNAASMAWDGTGFYPSQLGASGISHAAHDHYVGRVAAETERLYTDELAIRRARDNLDALSASDLPFLFRTPDDEHPESFPPEGIQPALKRLFSGWGMDLDKLPFRFVPGARGIDLPFFRGHVRGQIPVIFPYHAGVHSYRAAFLRTGIAFHLQALEGDRFLDRLLPLPWILGIGHLFHSLLDDPEVRSALELPAPADAGHQEIFSVRRWVARAQAEARMYLSHTHNGGGEDPVQIFQETWLQVFKVPSKEPDRVTCRMVRDWPAISIGMLIGREISAELGRRLRTGYGGLWDRRDAFEELRVKYLAPGITGYERYLDEIRSERVMDILVDPRKAGGN